MDSKVETSKSNDKSQNTRSRTADGNKGSATATLTSTKAEVTNVKKLQVKLVAPLAPVSVYNSPRPIWHPKLKVFSTGIGKQQSPSTTTGSVSEKESNNGLNINKADSNGNRLNEISSATIGKVDSSANSEGNSSSTENNSSAVVGKKNASKVKVEPVSNAQTDEVSKPVPSTSSVIVPAIGNEKEANNGKKKLIPTASNSAQKIASSANANKESIPGKKNVSTITGKKNASKVKSQQASAATHKASSIPSTSVIIVHATGNDDQDNKNGKARPQMTFTRTVNLSNGTNNNSATTIKQKKGCPAKVICATFGHRYNFYYYPHCPFCSSNKKVVYN